MKIIFPFLRVYFMYEFESQNIYYCNFFNWLSLRDLYMFIIENTRLGYIFSELILFYNNEVYL
jgi:hypothetical protein